MNLRALQLQENFQVPPVWFVAENFRFEEAFVEAARIMPRLGYLLKLDLVADTPLNARYPQNFLSIALPY
jgi:hypothetical protein